jgi:hypothetical protein
MTGVWRDQCWKLTRESYLFFGVFVLRTMRRVNMATALLFAVVCLVTVLTRIGSDLQVCVLNVVQQHLVAVNLGLGSVGHLADGTGLPTG